MITPTIGRVVWYHPTEGQRIPSQPNDQVLPALITYVWSDHIINIVAFTPNGESFGVTSVDLIQEGVARLQSGFCEWMPYQKGQAKKTEALEKELSK